MSFCLVYVCYCFTFLSFFLNVFDTFVWFFQFFSFFAFLHASMFFTFDLCNVQLSGFVLPLPLYFFLLFFFLNLSLITFLLFSFFVLFFYFSIFYPLRVATIFLFYVSKCVSTFFYFKRVLL